MMEDLLEQWMEEPIRNLNLLNQLIPQLIQTFDQKGDNRSAMKTVIGTIENIRDVLEDRGILKAREYAAILHPSEAAH